MTSANSVQECMLEFEKHGLIGRLDTDRPVPQVFKGPVVDKTEFEMIRTIQNVVRMGRATSIECDHIMFNDGHTLNFTPKDTLFVDCMVNNEYGYQFPEGFEIFEPGKINLGPLLSAFNVSLSAAHTA